MISVEKGLILAQGILWHLFRMTTLEESKYDFETRLEAQKYDLKFMRQRVNDLMGKKTVGKKVNIRK